MMRKIKPWTNKQLLVLMENYSTISNPRDLVPLLKKSYTALKSKATLLGLKRDKYAGSPWTPSKEELLAKLYSNTTNAEIADQLGMKVPQVDQKAFKLGLKKDKEFMYMHAMGTCFQKGHIPANKGKKMDVGTYTKAAPTMFKKGNLPGNTLHDGAITVRHDHKNRGGKPYKYIRISMGKWRPLHTHVWEQSFGKVPSGYCLWFKDGDPLNCDLSNLELITRGENMKRNSGSLNLSDGTVASYIAGKNHSYLHEEIMKNPKLIEAKRKQIILNRTINGEGNQRSNKGA